MTDVTGVIAALLVLIGIVVWTYPYHHPCIFGHKWGPWQDWANSGGVYQQRSCLRPGCDRRKIE